MNKTIRHHGRARRLGAELLCGGAIGLLALAATPAAAQSGAAAGAGGGAQTTDSAGAVEEIIVTGSRIVRDGYTAPTPVTVVSTDQLQRSAPGAIPEGLNQLPQFAGSRNNQTVGGVGTQPAGGNYLNLRNLGAIRTLTLLDGQRLPPTSFDGTVDANIIPQALIQRVEVVTGGASAAYGSDAVSGVINFVLDTKFNGVKGQAQHGSSTYSDAQSYKFNLAAGFGLADDKVHLLFSYDHYEQRGVRDNFHRPYGVLNYLRTGTGTRTNPFIEYPDVRYATATYGTLIATGTLNVGNPLRGMQFIPGGAVVPFNPGIPTGTSGFNRGGDGVISFGKTLTGTQNTDQAFGRADFDLGSGITAFAQVSYANSFNSFITIGSGTQINDFQIFAENPFLADSVRNTLNAAGVRSFVASRIEADQPPKLARFVSEALTVVSGLKGKIADYDWSLGYSHGDSLLNAAHEGNFDNSRWLAGLDAVRGPRGDIVCRITLTNPGVQDACVPINIFGFGSPSQAAYNYISQTHRYRVSQKMDIATANLSGELFQLPAGPVSVAVGGEYRRQQLRQTSNTDPSKGIDLTGIRTNVPPFILQYNSSNVGSAFGRLNVKEVYGEVVVPVFKDSPIGQSLELNGAGRYTDYSTSGGVSTWKVGLSYVPFESVRLRATKSRDIRAPTLYELYAGRQAARGQFNDRLTGLNNNAITYSEGNPDLKPEIGNTWTAGIVYSPSFFQRLTMSVDYYSIKITDAIGTLGTDTIQTQCEASNGTADVCRAIQRPFPYSNRGPENFPTAILSINFNQAAVEISGLDFEMSYRQPLGRMLFGDANLDVRLIGGRLFDYLTTANVGATPIQSRNSGNNTRNRVNLQLGYRDGGFSFDTQFRYLGSRKKTEDAALFYVNNGVEDTLYTDITAAYRFIVRGVNLEAYATVNNLFNTQPPLYSTGGQPGQSYPTNTAVYDVIGRYYTGGIRFRF